MLSGWHLRGSWLSTATILAIVSISGSAFAQGTSLFPTVGVSDKPQSKLWMNDGFWWACVNDSANLAIHKLEAGTWTPGLVLQPAVVPYLAGGTADALWDGTHLFVAAFGLAESRIYKLSYDAASQSYGLLGGFPIVLPMPTGAETLVIDEDSSGRVWATFEAGGKVQVYYSLSSDHTQWVASPLQISTQTVDPDDIATVVAFGGDKIGVLWSDQWQQQVCFRWRHDGDPPSTWQPIEIVRSGFGCIDDHLNMKADSQGRIYFVTKDFFDAVWVGKRDLDGTWSVTTGASGLDCGTRPILQIDESENKLHVFYTRWEACVSSGTHAIEERVAYLDNLLFSLPAVVIASSGVSMNDVQGTKQLLSPGSLVVVCEGSDGQAYWTGWGSISGLGGSDPGGSFPPPPAPPTGLAANLVTESPQDRMLLWRLDETSGSTASDDSGHNRNGTLGTGIAAPSWTTGLVNNGLFFNGDAYLTTSGAPFAFVGQSFTLEVWVKIDLTNAPGTGALFTRGNVIHSTFELMVSDPYIEFGWSTGDTTDVTVKAHESLRDGAWHHIAAVYDAPQGEARIYVDGDRQATKLIPPPVFGDPWDLTVGALKDGPIVDKTFSGWMDMAAISNAALYDGNFTPPILYPAASTEYVRMSWDPSNSQAGIAGYRVQREINGGSATVLNTSLVPNTWFADFAPVDGYLGYGVLAVDGLTQEGSVGWVTVPFEGNPPAIPSAPLDLSASFVKVTEEGVPYWEFDEGTGSETLDGSGLGHTAELGSPVLGDAAEPLWILGRTGRALHFDGSNDYVEVGDAADLRFTDSFTVEAWVRRTKLGEAQAILSKDEGSAMRNYLLLVQSSGAVQFSWRDIGGSTRSSTSSVAITDSDWHHVAGVYDHNQSRNFVFVDGIQTSSSSANGTPYTGPQPVRFGARGSSSGGGDLSDLLTGDLDLVRISPGVRYTGDFVPADLYHGGSKKHAVRITWAGPLTGLVKDYEIFRQELPAGPTLLLATLAYEPLPSFVDGAVQPGSGYRYTVRATNSDDLEGPASAGLEVTVPQPTDVFGEAPTVPAGPRLRLEPNPFNPTAVVSFRLDRPGSVDLALFDVRGRRLATVVRANLAAGEHRLPVFGDGQVRLASGVYFLRLHAAGVDTRIKAVLVR